jgi:hypothetical protein
MNPAGEPDWEVDLAAVGESVRRLGPLAARLPAGPVRALRFINSMFEAYEGERGPDEPDVSLLKEWMKDRVLAEYWTNAPGIPWWIGRRGLRRGLRVFHRRPRRRKE